MSDELTFRASDNKDAPDSPILSAIKKIKKEMKNKLTNKNNSVMDELTFNIDDNKDISESPILFQFYPFFVSKKVLLLKIDHTPLSLPPIPFISIQMHINNMKKHKSNKTNE